MFMDRRGRRFRRKKVRRMGMKRLLVVGATGDVGQGMVASASSLGWSVIAAGRNADKLSRFESAVKSVATVLGGVASEAGADALWKPSAACLVRRDVWAEAVHVPNACGGRVVRERACA